MVENELNVTPPHPDIATVQVAIEAITYTKFAQKYININFCMTRLYYKGTLQRWPVRHAAVISAIAQARPGGVLLHCSRGYDRTGIISLLLLALVGITLYELNRDPKRDALLAREGTSVRKAMRDTLEGLNLDDYLQKGGVSQA